MQLAQLMSMHLQLSFVKPHRHFANSTLFAPVLASRVLLILGKPTAHLAMTEMNARGTTPVQAVNVQVLEIAFAETEFFRLLLVNFVIPAL